MKIIEMKKIIDNGEPLADDDYTACDPNDWFCVIETAEEEALYEMAMGDRKPLRMAEEDMPIDVLKTVWDDLVCFAGAYEGVSWGDDDIYYYFRHDEKIPELGETFELDGDTWYRVA